MASADIEIFGETVDADFNAMSFGVGYRHAISTTADFFGVVSYEYIEVEVSFHQIESDLGPVSKSRVKSGSSLEQ